MDWHDVPKHHPDDHEEYAVPDESRIWRFGICACANPGRCCLSMLCPCATTAQLATKTQAMTAPVAFLASVLFLPFVVCFLRGKAREDRNVDGSDTFEGDSIKIHQFLMIREK